MRLAPCSSLKTPSDVLLVPVDSLPSPSAVAPDAEARVLVPMAMALTPAAATAASRPMAMPLVAPASTRVAVASLLELPIASEQFAPALSSEARRLGQEGVSTCKYRWV